MFRNESASKKAFFLIVLAGIMWGTSGIFVHYLSPLGFSPLQMVAARGSVSAVCMLLFAAVKRHSFFRAKPSELLLYALIGVSLFFTCYLYYAAISLTSIATAAMLLGLSPLYVILFSVIFFGEKISLLKGVSVGGILIGGTLVSGIIGGMVFDFFGILIGILAGVAYAVYCILTKISARRNCPAGPTTLYSFLVMAIIAISVSDPAGAFETISKAPMPSIPLLIGIGIVTFVFPYSMYTISLENIPVGTASSLGVIEPLTATLSSIFLFGESMSIPSLVGVILILLSIVLLGRATSNES